MWNLIGWLRPCRATRLERAENYLDGLRNANADFPGVYSKDVAKQERLVERLRGVPPVSVRVV